MTELINTNKKSILSKISAAKFIRSTVFAVTALFLVFLLTVQLIKPEKAIDIFGFRLFSVADTRSMEPLLKHNDLIVVVKYDFDKIEKGDIIAFNAQIKLDGKVKNVIITHVVKEIFLDSESGQKSFRTQSYNEEAATDVTAVTIDGINGTNQYIGKFMFKSTLLGGFSAFISGIYGLFSIAVILICSNLMTVIFNRFKSGDFNSCRHNFWSRK